MNLSDPSEKIWEDFKQLIKEDVRIPSEFVFPNIDGKSLGEKKGYVAEVLDILLRVEKSFKLKEIHQRLFGKGE